jgi:hypothetical protein
MNLNLYEQHFSYIKDLRSYSHSYLCSKCDRLWKHVGKLQKSRDCLCRHHSIHQLKQRQLCFSKYGLEEQLWHQLVVLEQVFSLNVYVYDLLETEAGNIAARLVRRSPYKYDDTMNLNLYEQHFSYIKDLRSY